MEYLVIYRTEDEVNMLALTKEELMGRLNDPDEWGTGYTFLNDAQGLSLDLEDFPGNTILVWGGEQIVPKAVKRVTEYTLGGDNA